MCSTSVAFVVFANYANYANYANFANYAMRIFGAKTQTFG
jgi:hypothetical protein